MTRNSVNGKIFTNYAIKQAIELFLEENPWAYEVDVEGDYHNIQF